MMSINDFINKIDNFAIPTYLIFNKENKVSSRFSQLISLLFYAYILLIFS